MEENKVETNEVTELQAKIAEYEAQVKHLKSTISERNAEAAQKKREAEEWQSKFESTLNETQLAEAKRKEAEEATAKELAELKRDNSINKYKAKYLSMGYTEELAESSAIARVDGNDDVLFQNESTFIKLNNENLKAEMLKEQPGIKTGEPPKFDEKTAQFNEMMKYAF